MEHLYSKNFPEKIFASGKLHPAERFPIVGDAMRIGVIGSRGQLGADLCLNSSPSDKVVRLDRPDFEFDNPEHLTKIDDLSLDVLINSAAYNDVDKAEDEIDLAFRLNAQAPSRIAAYCQKKGIRFITFSTDYVFGEFGKNIPQHPLREEDEALPISVYGVSKWAGERMVLNRNPDALVIRTCGLYGHHRGSHLKKNFVDLMLQLGKGDQALRVVSDQIVTPTSTWELSVNTLKFIQCSPKGGLYHMTNEGQCSWFEFAQAIFQLKGLTPDLRPVSQKEYGAKARRPSYSVLSKEKVGKYGISFQPWKSALSQYLETSSL